MPEQNSPGMPDLDCWKCLILAAKTNPDFMTIAVMKFMNFRKGIVDTGQYF